MLLLGCPSQLEEQVTFPKPDLGQRLAIDALFQRIDLNPRFQAAVCKQSYFLHTLDQGDSSGTGRARTGPVQQEESIVILNNVL